MKRSWAVLMMLLLVAGVAIGLSTPALEAQQRNLLVSKQTAAPPALDGTLDAAWDAAVPLTVKVVGGRNLPGGTTDVTLRSLHAGDSIYFHVQYRDATESMRRGPWIKQADGSWQQAKDPKFALKGNRPAPPYWIVDAEKEPFDDSKYKAGDEVPGIIVAPFTGDRG